MVKIPDIARLADQLRRRGSWLVIAWIALMLGLCFPYFEATRNANERPRILQAMALVDAGEWAIDGPAARGLDPGPDVSRSREDGRLYPNKPPGTSVVATLGVQVARATADAAGPTLRRVTFWTRALGGLLPTVLLAWVLLRRYAAMFGPAVGAGAVALYALGTPAASYAHLLYGHQLAAALLGVGALLLVDAGAIEARRGSAPTLAAAGGLLAGAAVGVEYHAVFAALPLAGLLLARLRRPGGPIVLLAGLGGALVSIAGLAAYHARVYGSPWSTGYHHVTNAEFAAKHGQGLLGLGLPSAEAFSTHILSADGGLLWWAPTVVLALYGLGQLALRGEGLAAEARVHLGLVVLYVVVVSSLSFEGGWRVGPRYLVLVLPSLCMGWAHVLSQARTSIVGMTLCTVLATYAVVVNALAANLWPHFDLTNIHQPVAEVLLPLWEHDREPYDLLRMLMGRSGLVLVVVGSVVGTWIMLARAGEGGLRMAAGMIAGGALGLLLVQGTRLVEPHPRGARNLAYIERIWEPP
ncbi:MAG: hypothetical protein KDK70_16345, partial [Myxococcales bacterium]|nr:hypothetical protein [Myxococcales bacterium]